MKPGRVLFTSHSPAVSGAEIVLLEILENGAGKSAFLFQSGPLEQALAERGVSVIASRWGDGLALVKRDRSLLRALPLALPIAAITFQLGRLAWQNDIIYANSQKAFILSAIATAASRCALIWHLHDIPDATHFGRAQLKLQIGLANRRAKRVIVPSTAVAQGFIAAGGKADLVRIVPNGVKRQPVETRSKETLRQNLQLPQGPLVGVFSRLAGWKGQDVLLRALADLPGVSCIIAGDALFGEEAYAADLKALVQQLGLADRVLFLGQRDDVPSLMRAVDIVVHPSTAPEPFGLTLVESMFAGTPVVATGIGAVPDILDDGRAGTLVPPGDPTALAEAIRSILANPNEQDMKTAHASERAEALYTGDRMRAAIFAIIDEVAAGKPS